MNDKIDFNSTDISVNPIETFRWAIRKGLIESLKSREGFRSIGFLTVCDFMIEAEKNKWPLDELVFRFWLKRKEQDGEL